VENALARRRPAARDGRRAQGAGRDPAAGADTGRGIPFHVQAHIFDRFIGRERGGPGLGLALVKALTELHGGWVALEERSRAASGRRLTCHLPERGAGGDRPQRELAL
jgi:nitrogen-specific signal transduction histidine kinase